MGTQSCRLLDAFLQFLNAGGTNIRQDIFRLKYIHEIYLREL